MSEFQNRPMTSVLALWILVGVGSGCWGDSTQPTVAGACSENSDCQAGQFCRDRTCYNVCGDTTDCSPNSTCKDLLCIPAECGDGLVEGREECDDKLNNSNSAACTQECKQATCGDGFIWAGEETCDDSNSYDGDGCDSNCTPTSCGNGIITDGEECDDGNMINTDGCESDCQFTECNASIPDGTLCESDDVFCNGIEVCDAGNCISPGNPCPEDEHDCTTITCEESAVECSTVISDGSCFIAFVCIANETVNEVNSCQFCDSAVDPLAWQIWGGDLTYTDAPYSGDEGKSVWESCGTGACAEGLIMCDNETQTLVCSTADQISEEDTHLEWNSAGCNGIDEDCDGTKDENYFWDYSNFADGEFDFYGDYPNEWSADLPLQVTYLETADPNQRLGEVYGRHLPAGDQDYFRIKVYEADSSWGTSDKKFHASISISAPTSYNLDLYACWSSYDEYCKYNGDFPYYTYVSGGTSQTLEFQVSAGTMVLGGTADIAYLDIAIKPSLTMSDYGCDEYEVSWNITEQ